MKRFLAVLILVAGCGESIMPPEPVMDQCLRAQLFKECMVTLPKGPESVHNSNDWSEVVDECNNASAQQSYRKAGTVRPECLGR